MEEARKKAERAEAAKKAAEAAESTSGDEEDVSDDDEGEEKDEPFGWRSKPNPSGICGLKTEYPLCCFLCLEAKKAFLGS